LFRPHGSREQIERGKGMIKVPLISKWVLCVAVVALGLGNMICGTTATAQGDAAAGTVVLDSDTGPLIPGIQNILIGPAGTAGEASGESGATGFRVVKVTNISGNNPFHPTQPVLNFGGVVVANVDDLLECIRGGTCKPGGDIQGTKQCSPSSTTNLHPVFGPASAAFYINPNTSACAAGHSAPALQEEGFYVYPPYCSGSDPAGSSSIGIYAAVGYQITGIGSTVPPGSYTFTLKKGTKSWKISMEVKKTGSSSMTCGGGVTIVSIWTITIKGITPLS
jgi:hypothetical protein